jgi:Flp pilus assembly protein TadD
MIMSELGGIMSYIINLAVLKVGLGVFVGVALVILGTQAMALAETGVGAKLIATGYNQLAQGDVEQAVHTFSQVVRVEPGNIQARRYLATALLRAGSTKEGLKQIQYVIQMEPQEAPEQTMDQVTLGEAYYQDGLFGQSIACLARIVNENQTLDTARLDLIKALIATKQFDNANLLCREGLQISQNQQARREFYNLMNRIHADKENQQTLSGFPTQS